MRDVAMGMTIGAATGVLGGVADHVLGVPELHGHVDAGQVAHDFVSHPFHQLSEVGSGAHEGFKEFLSAEGTNLGMNHAHGVVTSGIHSAAYNLGTDLMYDTAEQLLPEVVAEFIGQPIDKHLEEFKHQYTYELEYVNILGPRKVEDTAKVSLWGSDDEDSSDEDDGKRLWSPPTSPHTSISSIHSHDEDYIDKILSTETLFPFAQQNHYLSHHDPFSEGRRLVLSGAPLYEAALAFEATCKWYASSSEPWRALGETWCAASLFNGDARENKGIRALEKGLAWGGSYDFVATLMSLTIENCIPDSPARMRRAQATAEQWLSICYPTLQYNNDSKTPDRLDSLVDSFEEAAFTGSGARSHSTKAPGWDDRVPDVDVQIMRGALLYGSSKYLEAKWCFESALVARPYDCRLWNRLGASALYSDSPEEAVHAFQTILNLQPHLAQARLGLSLSLIAMERYHEGVECLLAVIDSQANRQDVGEEDPVSQEGSESLRELLVDTFFFMDRDDLAEWAQFGVELEAYRDEGFNF
ncbi:peroxin-5, partial [Phenoliferia sp. Uapishka_3]